MSVLMEVILIIIVQPIFNFFGGLMQILIVGLKRTDNTISMKG